MLKLKKKFTLFIFILLIFSHVRVYADNNAEEELDLGEVADIVREASSDTEKMPEINSRHAVIYDRNTRNSFVWKK